MWQQIWDVFSNIAGALAVISGAFAAIVGIFGNGTKLHQLKDKALKRCWDRKRRKAALDRLAKLADDIEDSVAQREEMDRRCKAQQEDLIRLFHKTQDQTDKRVEELAKAVSELTCNMDPLRGVVDELRKQATRQEAMIRVVHQQNNLLLPATLTLLDDLVADGGNGSAERFRERIAQLSMEMLDRSDIYDRPADLGSTETSDAATGGSDNNGSGADH